MLFNTISEDIITSSSVFFDKQDQSRYAEALHRVFDLAVGIESLDDLLVKEERTRLNTEITRLSRQLNRLATGQDDFREEQKTLVRRAKELGVIGPDVGVSDAVAALSQSIELAEDSAPQTDISVQQSDLRSDIALQGRIVRNLKLLNKEYDDYRKLLRDVEDSLRPVAFLRENLNELVQTSVFNTLMTMVERDFEEVKRDIRKKVPIDTNIKDLIDEHENSISKLQDELSSLPQEVLSFESDLQRLMFLGEVKAKLELYEGNDSGDRQADITKKIEGLEAKLEEVPESDPTVERNMFLKLLEEVIQDYITIAGSALANYQNYMPVFDYKNKTLQLRKPRTDFIENVGSSSNHMFLHLFLFLGLHEAMKIKNAPFVPPFLIIDQPSRPYWGDGKKQKKSKLNDSDEEKVRKAFDVLDSFVQRVVHENKDHCQLIVFEHVPPATWQGLHNVHLVEQFIHGNALVRLSDLAE